MKNFKKDNIITFLFAVGLSVGLVAGILLIILLNSKWYFLTIGIILCALGFYVMPLIWIKYGEMSELKSLLYAVERQNILDINNLSKHLQKNEARILYLIQKCNSKNYLTKYIFDGTSLKPTMVVKSNSCPFCGAKISKKDNGNYCEYCGTKF